MKDKILNIIDKIATIVVCLFLFILVAVILIGVVVDSFSVSLLIGIFTTLIVLSILWVLIRNIDIF